MPCCVGTGRAPTSGPNSLCWPPIWGTFRCCPPTITCHGLSRSERLPVKKHPPNLLGPLVREYFTDHLPRVRGTSPHTIHSYRDSLVLLLRFLSVRHKRPVAELDLIDLDPPGILAFLSHLEQE